MNEMKARILEIEEELASIDARVADGGGVVAMTVRVVVQLTRWWKN